MPDYYLDTEFMEDGYTIELLSIGVVCEDGREFYAENRYARLDRANAWVKENVLPHLNMVKAGDRQKGGGVTPTEIARGLVDFVSAGASSPRFWAWYGDYDWVVTCQLFGRMVDLPPGWPMLCLDLKQEHMRLGEPALPPQRGVEHNALEDARWNRTVHQVLRRIHEVAVSTSGEVF